jgi:hypothetical protein
MILLKLGMKIRAHLDPWIWIRRQKSFFDKKMPLLWIRIRSDFARLDPDPDPYWQNWPTRKKIRVYKCIVYKCWMFAFEGWRLLPSPISSQILEKIPKWPCWDYQELGGRCSAKKTWSKNSRDTVLLNDITLVWQCPFKWFRNDVIVPGAFSCLTWTSIYRQWWRGGGGSEWQQLRRVYW